MPVIAGSPITAAFYNSIQTKISNVLGVGSYDHGYGQTALMASSQVTVGETITASHWNKLLADINLARKHQVGASSQLAQLSGLITAAGVNSYETEAGTADGARLAGALTNYTLTSNVLTVSRASAWNGSIVGVAVVTFSDSNAARYFFNTGGEIRLSFEHPVATTPQDADWAAVLGTGVGVLRFAYGSTTKTGTVGAGSPTVGYHTLATNDQAIFSASNVGGGADSAYMGSGAYRANNVRVTARKNAAGNEIYFTVSMNDDHTNSFYDLVSAGTNFKLSQYKATGNGFALSTPSYAIVQSL